MKTLVVTPTLGNSAWLGETVASVAGIGGECRHVLVAPAAAVPALASQFPGVTAIPDSPRGGGMYAALNAGLAAGLDWDAFTYINDDDFLLPEFRVVLERVRAAARTSLPLVAYGGVRLIDARGRRLGAIPTSPAPGHNRELYAQGIEPVYQHGTVATRAAFERVGPFDATYQFCGDSAWLARACVRGVPFVRATRSPVAAFRLRAGQLTKNRAGLGEERARVDREIGLRTPSPRLRRLWVRLVFRTANLPVYAERILRFGPVRFDTVLARAG